MVVPPPPSSHTSLHLALVEVQGLQTTVKQYKQVFRDFVRFMQRERSVARDLQQVATQSKDRFAELVSTCRDLLSEKSTDLQMFDQLQNLPKQAPFEYALEQTAAHDLVVQKLRNEMLHLSSQAANCKLLSASQLAAFEEAQKRDRVCIRELESKLVEAQAHWTASERQLVTERDILKQGLLTLAERVELEGSTAQQLGVQLAAIREELSRVVSVGDTEHEANARRSSEMIQLKTQLEHLEKIRAQLSVEINTGALEGEINKLWLRVDQVHGQLSLSSASIGAVKADFARNLEILRSEHGVEISHLQRGHLRSIEELKTNRNNYLEYLRIETAGLEVNDERSSGQAILDLEKQIVDAERSANEWRHRALQNASEREEAKRENLGLKKMIQALQHNLKSSERDKQNSIDEARAASAALEKKLMVTRCELEGIQREVEQLRCLRDKNESLQQQIAALQCELEKQRHQVSETKPLAAWRTQPDDRSEVGDKTSNQHSHEIIDPRLRSTKKKGSEINPRSYRESNEWMSLLDRMKSGKVLPVVECLAPFDDPPLASLMQSLVSGDANANSSTREQSIPDDESPKISLYETFRRPRSRMLTTMASAVQSPENARVSLS